MLQEIARSLVRHEVNYVNANTTKGQRLSYSEVSPLLFKPRKNAKKTDEEIRLELMNV